MEIRITIKIKAGYYLEFLTPGTIKLLGSIKNKITKDDNGGNVPHFEISEVVLIYCKIVNNDYQQGSRVLNIFVPNKSFDQLLKIFDSELSYIEVWFTDHKSKFPGKEDKINITLVIN